MNPDDEVRLPAGWYPDPTGLPQLRWWDNHAWTQHTIAARQPLIVQEPLLAWPDDLPTRRERRERERDSDDETPPTAQSLRELDPPSQDDERVDEPAPDRVDEASLEAPWAATQAAATTEEDNVEESIPYAPLSASGHAGRMAAAPETASPATVGSDAPTPAPAPAPAPRQYIDTATGVGSENDTPLFNQVAATVGDTSIQSAAGRGSTRAAAQPMRDPSTGLSSAPISTAPVWVIALFPLLQLVVVLLLVTGLGSSQFSELIVPVIFIVVYLTMIALAIADYYALRRNGVERPAHWLWSLLTAPVYLFVRAMVLTRKTGRGFGPMLVWFALALLSATSVLAVPGMLIASVPTLFSAQAEQSIAADAAANGATLAVTCSQTPPILVGQTFSCHAASDTGKSFEVEVSLQRANGWIDWRVDDWGINTLSR